MLALLASVFLVAFVVVPGLVFRAGFRLFVPLRAFDRTRTQELTYSVVVCAVPFLLALTAVHSTPLGRWPFSFPDSWAQGDADYKTILLTSFGDVFAASRDEFWGAAVRSGQRLARLLTWHTLFVGLEALVLGWLASMLGTLQPRLAGRPWADRLLTRFLLPHISEWHVLLTNFLFPGTTIHVDVLTVEDRLYQGDVLTHARDQEGNLIGIYLSNAQRYDRARLLADRESQEPKATSEYWKPIPGKHLFIFADKIATLNIRPQTTLAAAEQLARELDPAAIVTVTRVEEPVPAGSLPPTDGPRAEGVSIRLDGAGSPQNLPTR